MINMTYKFYGQTCACILKVQAIKVLSRVSQKKRARKLTDKFGAVQQNALSQVPLFTYLIATLLTYHLQKTRMIFID